jgi:hypothetical protein
VVLVPTPDHHLSDQVRKELDLHGHAFTFAVLQRIDRLQNRAKWTRDVQEFPVEVQGAPTHIDFVLRNNDWGAAMVAECKRCDTIWIFARDPVASGKQRLVFEGLVAKEGALYGTIEPEPGDALYSNRVYEVGIESPRSAKNLEKAITQVCRGVNGLMGLLSRRLGALQPFQRASLVSPTLVEFVPVIFTTARLAATDFKLSDADLVTGRLPVEGFAARDIPWLFLRYNLSPTLRHDLPMTSRARTGLAADLKDILALDYSRMIAIVGAGGIDEFLTATHWEG